MLRSWVRDRGIFHGIVVMGVAIMVVPLSFWGSAGCGGHETTPPSATGAVPSTTQAVPQQNPMTMEDLVKSKGYSGHLVLYVDPSVGSTIPTNVQQVLDRHPSVKRKASVNGDPAKITAAREKLERWSKQKLLDWNTVYHLEVSDRDEALKVIEELKPLIGVKRIYPAQRGRPLELLSTPSLTGHQDYLATANVSAAWDMDIRGEDVIVVDNEEGMNFDHEELGLIANDEWEGGNYLYQPGCAPGFPPAYDDCDRSIAHGTAVAGILVARDNDHGITGFAPAARLLHGPMGDSTFGDLAIATNNHDTSETHGDDDIDPGSVWVIEVGLPGRFWSGSGGFSPEDQLGMVPTELWPEDFDAIQQATAYGITVVAGAGNGTVSLDDPTQYEGTFSFAHNLAVEDAGSIMVGAADSSDHPEGWSNCGRRVNSFALGEGVVTTGTPYSGGPYGWFGTTDPIPPNSDPNSSFIDMFGGTSSAAAIVGGQVVLLQSYAKRELGAPTKYLMPAKMREVVVGSGVAQASGDCNIGVSPRIDTAIGLIDTFLATIADDYPELASGDELTEERMIALRSLGVGLICRERDPDHSDPSCPDAVIWPADELLAKNLDVDGDGRADLIAAKNGEWKFDLSTIGTGGDNFGSWDVEIDLPTCPGRWCWPYAQDMNNDGRTDIVVYDKENGIWSIAYTTRSLLNGTWSGWDRTLNYSSSWVDTLEMDPNASHYSRPVLGDYNGDGRIDIAIACSDGYWRIDYQTETGFDEVWDAELKFLTDAQLAAAPGWAYLPIVHNQGGAQFIVYKIPDGLPQAGKLIMHASPRSFNIDVNLANDLPPIFGGNAVVPVPGNYGGPAQTLTAAPDIGLKGEGGSWQVVREIDLFGSVTTLTPDGIFGGLGCRPVSADYDGDGTFDRAVFCQNEWKIAYSGTTFGVESDGARHVALGYNARDFVLPGRPYFGGISYARVQRLIDFAQRLNPTTPSPIPVDMVDVTACLRSGPSSECR